MWLTPGRASGHKNYAPELFMMVELKRGHCTAHSTVLVIKNKSEEGGYNVVGLYPIYVVCNLMYCSGVTVL